MFLAPPPKYQHFSTILLGPFFVQNFAKIRSSAKNAVFRALAFVGIPAVKKVKFRQVLSRF